MVGSVGSVEERKRGACHVRYTRSGEAGARTAQGIKRIERDGSSRGNQDRLGYLPQSIAVFYTYFTTNETENTLYTSLELNIPKRRLGVYQSSQYPQTRGSMSSLSFSTVVELLDVEEELVVYE